MQALAIHLWTGASTRSWNICFDEVIKAYGFIQTFGEACIYKKVSGSSVAFLILYVDDILLIGNNTKFLDIRNATEIDQEFLKLLIYWASRSIEIDQDA